MYVLNKKKNNLFFVKNVMISQAKKSLQAKMNDHDEETS
jgi:hypothetical protein